MAQFLDCKIGAQVTWYGLTGIWVAELRLVDGRAVIVYGAIGTRLLHSIRPSGKFMKGTLYKRTRENFANKNNPSEIDRWNLTANTNGNDSVNFSISNFIMGLMQTL